MPTMPPTYRPPGFRSTRQRNREHDRRRRQAKPWRAWYNLAAWKARRKAQLTAEPDCRRCLDHGLTVPANTANHVVPHRGDWDLFIGGKLESLCKSCHDGEAQREERAADAAAQRAAKARGAVKSPGL